MQDGRVLLVGAWGKQTYFYDPATDQITSGPVMAVDEKRHGGSALLLAPAQDGKVMVLGGGGHGFFGHQSAAVQVLDVLAGSWAEKTSMRSGRRHFGQVLLPDGKVWVTGGGGGRFHAFLLFVPSSKTTELYDPETDTWTETVPLRDRRGYHHVTLLLPDGSALVAGEVPTAEIYYPPYFFQGPRPTIQAAPSSIVYGTPFSVTDHEVSGDPVAKVVLMRQGSFTHSYNFDARSLHLPFSRNAAGDLQVRAPATPSEAPPGYYLLFLLSQNELPSVGSWIKVTA